MKPNPIQNKGLIFVLSGPSGSGKTTLRDRLLEDRVLKKKLVKSISFATRPKRSGEQNGRDYFFISEALFRRRRRAKKILEWTKYLGYYYATPRDFVEAALKKGKGMVLCLDLKGAFRVRRMYPRNTVLIFIAPPSMQALKTRIIGRCHKTGTGEIRARLRLAGQELRVARKYDYRLVNKNLAQAARRLKAIILRKIKTASERRA